MRECVSVFHFAESLRSSGTPEALLPPAIRAMIVWSSFFWTKLIEDNKVAGRVVEKGYTYGNVRRWTTRLKNVDVRDCAAIVVPINHSNTHWALAIIQPQDHAIFYMDSLAPGPADRVTRNLLRWLRDEVQDKFKAELDTGDWTVVHYTEDQVPQQNNGCDCGAFLCLFAFFASIGLHGVMPFRQKHITQLRRFIGHSLLKLTLGPWDEELDMD